MLKNFFCILILIFIIYTCPIYANQQTAEISKIENNFYGFDYSNDSLQNRITRLEKAIYGKAATGDINKRLNKLSKDINADVIGLEISPAKDTFMEKDDYEKADNTVKYPIVDEIEQKLFNKTYPERDFHTRIVTIEKKLFGKIYDVDDYSTRMDRIKTEIIPEKLVQNDNFNDYDGSYYNDEMINSMDFSPKKSSKFSMPFGQKKYSRPYNNYGNFSSSSGTLEEELAQMEYDTFGTEFSNESVQSRIKRLNSVNKAKKSSKKYDSQKFSQHMSTAMEIGAMILMVLAMIL